MTRPMLSGLIYAARLTWLIGFLALSAGAFVGAFKLYSGGYGSAALVALIVAVLAWLTVVTVKGACDEQ